MRRLILVGVVWLLGSVTAAPAFAQASVVTGDWSGSFVGVDGLRRYAISFNADETFLAVLALPNGTTQRVWGRYRSTRINPMEIAVTFSNQGWRPLEICVKEMSLVARCKQYSPVPVSGVVSRSFSPEPVTVKFSTPSSFQMDGTTWNRDATHPLLFSQLIPDHVTLTSTRGSLSPGLPAYKKYELPP